MENRVGLRLFHRNSADEPIALPNLSAQALIQLLSGCYCLRVADRFNDLDGLASARAIQAEYKVTPHTEPPGYRCKLCSRITHWEFTWIGPEKKGGPRFANGPPFSVSSAHNRGRCA